MSPSGTPTPAFLPADATQYQKYISHNEFLPWFLNGPSWPRWSPKRGGGYCAFLPRRTLPEGSLIPQPRKKKGKTFFKSPLTQIFFHPGWVG